jgi:peptide/nickel transport system ATP-binding protein
MTTTRDRAGGTTEVAQGEMLIEVNDLTMEYKTKEGRVSAVAGVSFALKRGDSLGLVGESGCGKTSVALTLLRLQASNAEIMEGEILLGGLNLLDLSEEEMRRHRWSDIAMVFQGAMNAWNPVYRIGEQIREALDLHWPVKLTHQQARERIAELFELVGLPAEAMDRYPHEFSGSVPRSPWRCHATRS